MLCLYFQPQREESAGYVWDLIQNCLEILGISEEEALGLWSLLAAIYHLGFAGVKKGIKWSLKALKFSSSIYNSSFLVLQDLSEVVTTFCILVPLRELQLC